MEYQEVREKLVTSKQELIDRMKKPTLSLEEKEYIQKSIDNYDYIIELTDMNHHGRG